MTDKHALSANQNLELSSLQFTDNEDEDEKLCNNQNAIITGNDDQLKLVIHDVVVPAFSTSNRISRS